MKNEHSDYEARLDQLFASYRDACPEIEPGANFMPELWARIEARQAFWPSFEHLARVFMAAVAVACLVLVMLNVAATRQPAPIAPSYAEALAAEQNVETTYYADAVQVNDTSWERAR